MNDPNFCSPPCKTGELCVDNSCVDDPCDPNPCGTGQFCSNGGCFCDSDVGCSQGQVCNESTGICVQCESNEQCPPSGGDPNDKVCNTTTNTCVECILPTNPCPGDLVCNDSGQCVEPVRCNGRAVTVTGTSGNDNNLEGTNGPDVIHSLGGNDVIHGFGGDDIICGGPGDDILLGGVGNDHLFGLGNEDVIIGNDGDDRLFGGGQNDVLKGGNGDDRLGGGAETDFCDGGNHVNGDDPFNCEFEINIP